jgi:hypothetical protein
MQLSFVATISYVLAMAVPIIVTRATRGAENHSATSRDLYALPTAGASTAAADRNYNPAAGLCGESDIPRESGGSDGWIEFP